MMWMRVPRQVSTKKLCGKEQELAQHTSVSSIKFPAKTPASTDTSQILHDILKVHLTGNYHADCIHVYMKISNFGEA